MPSESDDLRTGGSFPATRLSVIAAATHGDATVRRVAWEQLVSAYWKPVYKYLRLRWRADADAAADLTQEFFARALEKSFFDRFDAKRARFRTFLRVCVDGFASNQRQAAARLKRGGGARTLSLDFESAEGELRGVEPPAEDDVDRYFQREWTRSLFELALADLRALCERQEKLVQYALFVRYDIDAPSRGEKPAYADLAREHGLPVTQVTNFLAWARRELRRLVLERLHALCATEEEFRDEARALLGVDGP